MSYSDVLDFGKHYRLSLSQVMFRDPDWFFWAMESGVLARHGYESRAAEICDRATHIRIPRAGSAPWVAKYVVRRERLWAVEVVPASFPREFNAPCLPWFDLSYARSLCGRMDKTGADLIVRAVKSAWYGNSSERMDRQKCDGFFKSDEHFVFDGEDAEQATGASSVAGKDGGPGVTGTS
jgi:hypothetical protein